MRAKYLDQVRNYHRDPYFPTVLPLAMWFAALDVLWYRRNGLPRWFKPGAWDNPISNMLNRSLFARGTAPRKLKLWERFLLWAGF